MSENTVRSWSEMGNMLDNHYSPFTLRLRNTNSLYICICYSPCCSSSALVCKPRHWDFFWHSYQMISLQFCWILSTVFGICSSRPVTIFLYRYGQYHAALFHFPSPFYLVPNSGWVDLGTEFNFYFQFDPRAKLIPWLSSRHVSICFIFSLR